MRAATLRHAGSGGPAFRMMRFLLAFARTDGALLQAASKLVYASAYSENFQFYGLVEGNVLYVVARITAASAVVVEELLLQAGSWIEKKVAKSYSSSSTYGNGWLELLVVPLVFGGGGSTAVCHDEAAVEATATGQGTSEEAVSMHPQLVEPLGYRDPRHVSRRNGIQVRDVHSSVRHRAVSPPWTVIG